MKPANASRQPFKCYSFKVTKPFWWNNPLHPQKPHHLFSSSHAFYSWVLEMVNIFQPDLSLVSRCPCSSDCQRKGQLSFSQQKKSLLVPHLLQCVHKNLHNSRGKCQHTGSMTTRRVRHYSCLTRCDVEELAENDLPANRRNKRWIMLFSFTQAHRNC